MRIITGQLGGRTFESPKGHRTHPMSDKVRGALFNTLGDITGMTMLDAFAGSGAIGLEAVSRGAKQVVAIDSDRRAYDTLKRNIENLNVTDKISPIRAYVNAWSTRHQAQKFDIVVADPPYDNLPFRDLKVLPTHIKDGGMLVISWPGKTEPYYIAGYEEIQIKDYGDAQLVFYRRTK